MDWKIKMNQALNYIEQNLSGEILMEIVSLSSPVISAMSFVVKIS